MRKIEFTPISDTSQFKKQQILDRTHTRLFTIKTFTHLLTQYGFQVEEVSGFAPSIEDLISKNRIFVFIERVHSLLSRLFPRLLGYNFLVTATKRDSIEEILERTIQ